MFHRFVQFVHSIPKQFSRIIQYNQTPQALTYNSFDEIRKKQKFYHFGNDYQGYAYGGLSRLQQQDILLDRSLNNNIKYKHVSKITTHE